MAHWHINIEFDDDAKEAEQVKQAIASAAHSGIVLNAAAAKLIVKQVNDFNSNK